MRSWKGLSCGLRLTGAVAPQESNFGTAHERDEIIGFLVETGDFGSPHHKPWAAAFRFAAADEA